MPSLVDLLSINSFGNPDVTITLRPGEMGSPHHKGQSDGDEHLSYTATTYPPTLPYLKKLLW